MNKKVKEYNKEYTFALFGNFSCRLLYNRSPYKFYYFETIDKMMIWLKINHKRKENDESR